MRYLLNISGGAGSAVCWLRALERYGDAVTAVFADTNTEDPDLYRFLSDLEQHTGRQIVRLTNDGKNIWDVFRENKMLTAKTGGCKASWVLKQLPLRAYTEQHFDPLDTVILIGMGPDEDDRQVRVAAKAAPFAVDFPLCWEPRLFTCDVFDVLEKAGIRKPSLYDKGYPHNNCGGTCIMAGIAQWCGVLKDYPERFAKAEAEEQALLAMMRERGRKAWTILKDRRGGVYATYSLRQLREDVEAGRRVPDDEWRTQCTCMLW